MPTPAKKNEVAEVRGQVVAANGLVLTDFRGLSVTDMNALRQRIREAGGHYRVVKNRLFALATQGTPAEPVGQGLTGPTGVLFSPDGDPAHPKAVLDYAQGNPALEITAGFLDGQALTSDQVKVWSAVPPMPVLLGEIAGAVQAPLTGILSLLQTMVGEVAHLIGALADQKDEAAA